jgi:hypothetical protein
MNVGMNVGMATGTVLTVVPVVIPTVSTVPTVAAAATKHDRPRCCRVQKVRRATSLRRLGKPMLALTPSLKT